jgi:hypothetical protein
LPARVRGPVLRAALARLAARIAVLVMRKQLRRSICVYVPCGLQRLRTYLAICLARSGACRKVKEKSAPVIPAQHPIWRPAGMNGADYSPDGAAIFSPALALRWR